MPKKSLVGRPNSGRNNKLYDGWSLVHLFAGILLGVLLPALLAIVLMVLWEPLEILVLSPLLARRGIDFGFETLKNSLSDIVVDAAGVTIGYLLLTYHPH